MTDRIALGLFMLIALALFLDYWFQDMDGLIFLGAKLGDLIEWLAFWR
ncbi:hypothetical protein [Roseovarius sp. Pro17]|nr:hypothetical protein [Roseovarius sp. Pro17]